MEGIIDSIKHGRKVRHLFLSESNQINSIFHIWDFQQVEYLVKWENYPVNDCSWVKEKDMHCDDILKKFKRGKKYKHEECKYFNENEF